MGWTFLEQVLSSRARVLDLLKGLTEGWTSGSERGHAGGHVDHVKAAARDLEVAWGRSLHCLLQLQTRLQILMDWSAGLQRDGGTLGERRFRVWSMGGVLSIIVI